MAIQTTCKSSQEEVITQNSRIVTIVCYLIVFITPKNNIYFRVSVRLTLVILFCAFGEILRIWVITQMGFVWQSR